MLHSGFAKTRPIYLWAISSNACGCMAFQDRPGRKFAVQDRPGRKFAVQDRPGRSVKTNMLFDGVMDIQGLNFVQKKINYGDNPEDAEIVTVPLKNASLTISREQYPAVGPMSATTFSKLFQKQGIRAHYFLDIYPNVVQKYTFTTPHERLTFLVGCSDTECSKEFKNPLKFPLRRLIIGFIHEILVDGKYKKIDEYKEQFSWSSPPHPFDKFRQTLENFFNQFVAELKSRGRDLANLRKVVGLSETLTQIGYEPELQDFNFPDNESRTHTIEDLVAAEFSRRVEREPTIETVREFRSDLEGTIAAATTKPYELPADVMTVVGSFLSGQKGTLAMQSKKLKYTP